MFINGLFVEVEQAGLVGKARELLFADDFVGVSESVEQLQRVIDMVHTYCRNIGDTIR